MLVNSLAPHSNAAWQQYQKYTAPMDFQIQLGAISLEQPCGGSSASMAWLSVRQGRFSPSSYLRSLMGLGTRHALPATKRFCSLASLAPSGDLNSLRSMSRISSGIQTA